MMKLSKLLAAPIVMGLMFGSQIKAAPILRHPTLLTLDVQDCGANRNLSSSVKITTKIGTDSISVVQRFEFKNIANGQVIVTDYSNMQTNHSFSLQGGYYTFKVLYKATNSPEAYPKSVQLVYDTPIAVPSISATGQCLYTVDPRVR